jgi:hypothetical protein
MATVTVEINGRSYAVGCADGQEERVRILAKQFDGHVRQVSAEVGHVGDLRLFLMAGLMLADELHEVILISLFILLVKIYMREFHVGGMTLPKELDVAKESHVDL